MRLAHLLLEKTAIYRIFSTFISPSDGRETFARETIKPKTGDRILDIGCGPADIFPFLGDVKYTGFDANPAYIARAKERFGERATFKCQRVSEESLRQTDTFDIVLAQGIVHHLDDTEAAHLFDIAHAALRPGGRLVTIDPAFAPEQSRIARMIVARDRGQHVRSADAYIRLASRRFLRLTSSVRHDLLRVPYTHLLLECIRTD